MAIGLPGRDWRRPICRRRRTIRGSSSVRQRTDVFAGVTAFNLRDFKVASDTGAERVVGQYVSGNYHALVGVPMALGRGFSCRKRPRSWQQSDCRHQLRLLDPPIRRRDDIVGQTLVVGGRSLTIVGVTAAGFEGMEPGRSIDITLPLSIRIQDEPDFLTWLDSWTSMPLVARLKPGVDVRQAEAVLQSVFREHMSQPETQRFSRGPDGQLRTALAAAGGERSRSA